MKGLYMHPSLEKHLLSLLHCGCYINTREIVSIGETLGFDLAFKNRSLLLQNLFIYTLKEEKTVELATHLIQLLEDKKQDMLLLVTNYPFASSIMRRQIDTITRTQQRLNQELILHVKGK